MSRALPPAVKSRLLDFTVHGPLTAAIGAVEDCDEDTSRRARRHLSEEVTAMQIPGFRGELIAADHADYDTPEPSGTAPSTGAPD